VHTLDTQDGLPQTVAGLVAPGSQEELPFAFSLGIAFHFELFIDGNAAASPSAPLPSFAILFRRQSEYGP